ncbi:MAG TPA: histidine phosphatase family protein [Candidatus Saccharimonadales bacterium]|nr:histidine phosphatase family protein [Candidatus Saccharimonadales bacterium]
MITIIFEPHSTTRDNEAGTAAGWYDVELSDLGMGQAKQMGERYKDQSFDAIFCSDLQRSYKTAQLAFGDKYPIVQDTRLRECNYGDFNRAPKKEIESMKAEAVESPFPNGESYQDTSARMKAFLQDLLKDYDGKTVLIIGHRATQYGLEEHVKGLKLTDIVVAPWQWQPGWKYELQDLE